MSTIEKINDIFRQIFNGSTIILRPEMTANDIDGWDFVAHLNLIMSIETAFDIQLSDDEVSGLESFCQIGQTVFY